VKRKKSRKEKVNVNRKTLKETLSKNEFVLVDFWSPMCAPCEAVSPIAENICKETGVMLAKMNVAKNYKTAMRYSIMSTPTILLFQDGKEVDRRIGSQSYSALKEMVETALDSGS
jgi:thioredoxin 1